MNGWVNQRSWQRWVPIRVGATPLNSSPQAGPKPNAGAGVSAAISIGNSKTYSSLSAPEKAVVWSTELAVTRLANGDPVQAAGVVAGQVLAVGAYYAVKALSEGTAKAATAGIQSALSSVSQFVPLIGAMVSCIADFIDYAKRTDASVKPGLIEQCSAGYSVVTHGNGSGNEVLPADLFMGSAQIVRTGVFKPDVFGLNLPYNNASLTRLLVLLEEPSPSDSDYKAGDTASAGTLGAGFASKVWPKGLTAEERGWLRQLRLGISACYHNVPDQRRIIDENTDGGTALFTLYLGVLSRAWLEKRLSHSWLTWRLMVDAGKWSDIGASAAFRFASAMAANPPSAYVNTRDWWEDKFGFSTGPQSSVAGSICPLYDYRTVDSLVDPNQGLVPGWLKTLEGQKWLSDEMNRGSGFPWTSALLLGALGAGGFYLVRPTQAMATYRTAKGFVTNSASKIVSTGKSLVRKVSQ